jgi:hypothetical protein
MSLAFRHLEIGRLGSPGGTTKQLFSKLKKDSKDMPTTRSQARAAPRARRASRATTINKHVNKRKAEETTPSKDSILINRAPVLTLWAAVVAEREGFSFQEGLTYGRYVSGMLAQSKGRSLGIYEAHEKTEAEKKARKRRDEQLGVHRIDTFGLQVPVVHVGEGENHAVSQGKPIDPGSVYSYLIKSFKGEESTLNAVKEAMQSLAESIPKKQVGKKGYSLYEQFRPEWKGWGGKGHLSLDMIRNMGKSEA